MKQDEERTEQIRQMLIKEGGRETYTDALVIGGIVLGIVALILLAFSIGR